MKKLIYFTGFGVVALSVLSNTLEIVCHLLGVNFPLGILGTLTRMFGSPVPSMLRFFIPTILYIAITIGMALLILRRTWFISTSKNNQIPSSFNGILYKLVSISVISLGIGFLVLILSFLLKAGSGVGAGILLIPAAVLLAPSIALIELLSFRAPKPALTHHSSGTPNGAP